MSSDPSSGSSPVAPLIEGDPDRIGPYRLAGRLGSGGMGTVYAGLNPAGERVAVKTVHRQYASDPEFRERFAREVDLLGRIRSTCAVGVLDADTTGAQPWLVSEYVPGPTLSAYVHAHGPLTDATLAGAAAGIAEALRAVHAGGIVHRDLKPGNVILSPRGPRLLDFGIARAVEETAITRTGGVIGTPGWLAPEQYDGIAPDPAADMFAFGAVVAYASTGREPFGTGPADMLVYRTRRQEPDLEGVHPYLLPLVRACLDKNPAARPTAAEALDATLNGWPERVRDNDDTLELTRLLDAGWNPRGVRSMAAGEWTPAPAPGRRSRVLLPAAAGLALVLVAGCLTVLVPSVHEATWGRLAQEDPPTEVADTEGEGDADTGSVPCDPDDEARTAAHEQRAIWRPFDPQALPEPEYERLLAPFTEGELIVDSEIWPWVTPLDHDTAEFLLSTPAIEDGFPVATVCWAGVEPTSEGMEFTAHFTYQPTLGSHTVYEEDFLTMVSLDPEQEGTDKEVLRGGVGEDWSGPVNELAVLDPENPTAEVVVLIPGAPERGGVAYQPAAYAGGLNHEPNGHCYDVDGTEEWRDDTNLGGEQFALSDYRPEQSELMACPTQAH